MSIKEGKRKHSSLSIAQITLNLWFIECKLRQRWVHPIGTVNWYEMRMRSEWGLAGWLMYVVCAFLVLRKQARKLENEIDIKLVAYSKVGSSPVPTTSVDTAPLLGEHIFDSLSMEIEQMLDKVCCPFMLSCTLSRLSHMHFIFPFPVVRHKWEDGRNTIDGRFLHDSHPPTTSRNFECECCLRIYVFQQPNKMNLMNARNEF